MLVAVHNLREHVARDGVRLILGLREPHQRARAVALERGVRKGRVEQHVGEERQRRLELVPERREADRARFAAHVRENRSAEQLLRIRQLIRRSGFRPLAEHLRRKRGDAKFVSGLVIGRAADEVDVQRDQREVAFFNDDQLRAVRQLRSRPCWHSERRRLAHHRRLLAIERLCRELRCQRGEREGERKRESRGWVSCAGDHYFSPMM